MKSGHVKVERSGEGRYEILGRAGRIGMVLGGQGVWSAETGKQHLGTAPTRQAAVQMVAIKAAVEGKL